MAELDVHEANALAHEHGGVLCFLSDNHDHEWTALGTLSLWESPVPGIVLLRYQNEGDDVIVRIRWRDLCWLMDEGPQPRREGDDS